MLLSRESINKFFLLTLPYYTTGALDKLYSVCLGTRKYRNTYGKLAFLGSTKGATVCTH
jgi:hypothetical protein